MKPHRPIQLLLLPLILVLLAIPSGGPASMAGYLAEPPHRSTTEPLASAVTYYVSPSGNDSHPGTQAQPWATFERAWQSLRRGDTLVLMDGVYHQSLAPRLPPVDSQQPIETQYVTIKSQHDGKAILEGDGVRVPVSLNDYMQGSFVIIEGIVAQNSSDDVYHITGPHNILRRVSGYNANTDENTSVFTVWTDDTLLEDCVAAGTGRKMILVFSHNSATFGQRNVIRRCFAHWQGWDGRNFCPIPYPYGSNIEIYNASNNTIENSIGYANVPSYNIGFKASGPGVIASGNKILGSMALYGGRNPDGSLIAWPSRPEPTECDYDARINEPGSERLGFWIGGGGTLHDNLLQDVLAYGNTQLGLSFTLEAEPDLANNRLVRATVVGNGLDNPNCYPWEGPTPCGPGDTTRETLGRFSGIQDSYIERIREGTFSMPGGITSMSGSGALLMNRYVDGVLTGEPLWPWPMEERIQAELGLSVTGLVSSLLKDLGMWDPQLSTFADVPSDHPYHDAIEALYQGGYTAGCATDPLRYCPDQTMNRAESAVFVERGVNGTDGLPPQPTTQTFADLPLDSWAAKWAEALWQDHYTAGCGTDPLVYCPWQGHTRAEGCVFHLHMLNGPDYAPPQPAQRTFADVPLETWYAKWVQAAYDAGLIPACQTSPQLQFCPDEPLSRGLAAHMMVQAKGLY